MRLLIAFLCAISFSCWGGSIGDPESQNMYDKYLSSILTSSNTLSSISLVNIDGAPKDGDELWVIDEDEDMRYRYYLHKVKPDGVVIRATTEKSGNSYYYDTKWNVVYYSFDTEEEEGLKVGRQLLRWLADDDLSEAEVDNLLVSMGWRGALLSPSYNTTFTKYDLLGSVGSFLVYDELREKIWDIVLTGRVYKNCRGREVIVRSILSCFDDYPEELKQEVIKYIKYYIPRAIGENAFRTEDIVSHYNKMTKRRGIITVW